MPKIVINEYDKTTAGSTPYENFTVVVPGPIVKLPEGTFDANGVYEFSSQKEFKEIVGKIKAVSINVEASGPKGTGSNGEIEELEFKKEKLGADGKPVVDPETKEQEYEFDTEAFKEAFEKGNLYKKINNSKVTSAGYLKEVETQYIKVKTETEGVEGGKFVFLTELGNDARTCTQYGNQIAWELLGLGYKVLYKCFSVSPETKKYEVDKINTVEFWDCLKDKSEYDFRYVLTGTIEGNELVNERISKLCKDRGDCTALVDIDASLYNGKTQQEAVQRIADNIGETPMDKNTAAFAPYVKYDMATDKDYDNNIFPASFHYLACAARASENYSEWYAVAGYTRGVSKYTIDSVGCVFGETAITALEPRNSDDGVDKAINLIVKIKNNFYLWGNRTTHGLNNSTSTNGDLIASHFLNIRQLCTTIKKQVYVACRRFTFDPNSDLLWLNFCNAIKPTLEKMRADQGIADYKLIKVKAPKKATLRAKIRIVPIEAVEDFEIDLYLEDSLNGTVIAEQ